MGFEQPRALRCVYEHAAACSVLCCVMCHRMIEEGSKRGKAMVEKRQLFMEMSEWSRPLTIPSQNRQWSCFGHVHGHSFGFGHVFAGAQNFDVIRLSTYRTACKLRFVQKRCNRKFWQCNQRRRFFSDMRVLLIDRRLPVRPPSQFIWWMCGTWSKPFVTTGSTRWTTTPRSMCPGWRPSCLPSTTSSTSGCPPPTRSMWNSLSGCCSTSWWPHTTGTAILSQRGGFSPTLDHVIVNWQIWSRVGPKSQFLGLWTWTSQRVSYLDLFIPLHFP